MIAIALLTLVPGRVGGSETYARALLAHLDPDAFDYRVVTSPLAPEVGGRLPTVVATEFVSPSGTVPRLLATGRAAFDPRLRRRFAGADVVHYPLTVTLPPVRGRTVVTLLDLQHRELPQLFSRADRAYRAVAYDRAAQRADHVIAISEFVRERAIDILGLDERKITAVPLAIDHELFRPGDEQREPFLLYPARPWPHKNHQRLYTAFAQLRRDRPDLRLVLTGGGDFGPLPDGVETRGLVTDQELAHLYRTAQALVFPSLYEGFGQPPLEAMASGCPVACSNTASLPEVVGTAARTFDPHDPDDIAAAVTDILQNPQPWTRAGLQHAAHYSWTTTAHNTEQIYRELL